MLEKLDIAVINLDRRPDRMAYIYKHIPFLFRPMTFDISGFNMPGWDSVGGGGGGDERGYYRRFPAIDGLNLSQHYAEFPDLLDTIRDKPRVLGEVGCSLSHYSLWKSHALRPKSDILLVFEDDVLFTDKSLERIKCVLAGLTASASASAVEGATRPSFLAFLRARLSSLASSLRLTLASCSALRSCLLAAFSAW